MKKLGRINGIYVQIGVSNLIVKACNSVTTKRIHLSPSPVRLLTPSDVILMLYVSRNKICRNKRNIFQEIFMWM